jgi:predicted Rossmann fold flavoprotein
MAKQDVIIIGAGAAGLMCALEAGKRNRSVLVLEHRGKAGKKIRISGGGHCNFTNLIIDSSHYLSHNPHFSKSALARFTPQDFIALLERHAIPFHKKENGQLFCVKSSGEIIRMLLKECNESGVTMRMNCQVTAIRKRDGFYVTTNQGIFQSRSLVFATGGLSYPELGATNLGYRIAQEFGLRVTQLKPGLVPLTFSRDDIKKYHELSGISINAEVRCRGTSFKGGILFTHQGLSGPAILQISSYWSPGDVLSIDLLPGVDCYELFVRNYSSRIEMRNFLSHYLPRRFIQKWCDLYIQSKPLCQYSEKELGEIEGLIHAWQVTPAGTEGYDKAEVTLGGIDTDELSSKTMEVKTVPGLYFVGEVVDVTGRLGGYNLQWAWASGYAAGNYV